MTEPRVDVVNGAWHKDDLFEEMRRAAYQASAHLLLYGQVMASTSVAVNRILIHLEAHGQLSKMWKLDRRRKRDRREVDRAMRIVARRRARAARRHGGLR